MQLFNSWVRRKGDQCSAVYRVISDCLNNLSHNVHTDSENPSITITALLASLNSCCNPWIYMFFSGHLLQDCVQSFPCCQRMAQKFTKDESDNTSRRQTSYSNNQSPTNSTRTWKDSPKSFKSIRFIPVSTWATHPCSLTLGGGCFGVHCLNLARDQKSRWVYVR